MDDDVDARHGPANPCAREQHRATLHRRSLIRPAEAGRQEARASRLRETCPLGPRSKKYPNAVGRANSPTAAAAGSAWRAVAYRLDVPDPMESTGKESPQAGRRAAAASGSGVRRRAGDSWTGETGI